MLWISLWITAPLHLCYTFVYWRVIATPTGYNRYIRGRRPITHWKGVDINEDAWLEMAYEDQFFIDDDGEGDILWGWESESDEDE